MALKKFHPNNFQRAVIFQGGIILKKTTCLLIFHVEAMEDVISNEWRCLFECATSDGVLQCSFYNA